jgi:hypothetical protein
METNFKCSFCCPIHDGPESYHRLLPLPHCENDATALMIGALGLERHAQIPFRGHLDSRAVAANWQVKYIVAHEPSILLRMGRPPDFDRLPESSPNAASDLSRRVMLWDRSELNDQFRWLAEAMLIRSMRKRVSVTNQLDALQGSSDKDKSDDPVEFLDARFKPNGNQVTELLGGAKKKLVELQGFSLGYILSANLEATDHRLILAFGIDGSSTRATAIYAFLNRFEIIRPHLQVGKARITIVKFESVPPDTLVQDIGCDKCSVILDTTLSIDQPWRKS